MILAAFLAYIGITTIVYAVQVSNRHLLLESIGGDTERYDVSNTRFAILAFLWPWFLSFLAIGYAVYSVYVALGGDPEDERFMPLIAVMSFVLVLSVAVYAFCNWMPQ